MIFVTVGTQLPFDRLVAGVGEWQARNPDMPVFGQIGKSALQPTFPCVDYLRGRAFETRLNEAGVVVSHAGIGIILTCWSLKKPLIVVPRQHRLGEHRSDHQTATVKHLSKMLTLSTADTSEALHALLSSPWDRLVPVRAKEADAARISAFVNGMLAESAP
jgi:UDP-N-acetylglucosamine transferase subunit ALG13